VVRLLLDTHLLLWALSDPKRVGRTGLTLIERSDVYVSAASIWEISIKAAQGRLKARPDAVLQGIEPAGFALLPIQGEHAARVFDLGMHHADPFDRLLIAQAQLESMTLLTNDELLAAYGKCVHVI
jgi:PIN domain nuclease of toxin-antitoxin system